MADNVVPILFKVIDGATAALKHIREETEKTGDAAEGSTFNFGELTAGIQLLQGAVGIIGSMGGALVGLNKEAENTTVILAGVIKASGLITDFNAAESAASGMLDTIRTKSAALPGEADDYITIIRTALPKALEAGLSLDQVTEFGSNFGAVTSAMGISAGQAGADLSRLLGGQAGNDMPAWVALGASIGMTADEFQKLSKQERVHALMKGIAKYQPMVDAFNDTWDTATSTFISGLKDMSRVAGQPLFTILKKELQGINAWLDENKVAIGEVITAVGTGLVNAFKDVKAVVMGIVGAVEQYGKAMISAPPFQVGMHGAAGALGDLVSGGVGGAISGVSGAAGGAAVFGSVGAAAMEVFIAALVGGTAVFSPLIAGAALLAGGFVVFLGNANAVAVTLGAVGDIFASLMTAVEPLSSMFWMLSGMVGDALIAIVPPIMDVIAIAVEVIMGLFTVLMDVLNPIIGVLAFFWKILMGIVGVIIRVGDVLLKVFMLALREVAGVFKGIYDFFSGYLKPVFDKVMSALDAFINEVYKWIEMLGAEIDRETKGEAPPEEGKVKDTHKYIQMDELIAHLQEGNAARKAAGARPSAGNSYDFRGSRFDIKQDFAEGFDPDRIAVAFANDLATLGERKMQSGFGPLFAVR